MKLNSRAEGGVYLPPFSACRLEREMPHSSRAAHLVYHLYQSKLVVCKADLCVIIASHRNWSDVVSKNSIVECDLEKALLGWSTTTTSVLESTQNEAVGGGVVTGQHAPQDLRCS